jgi:hypothetical protein
MKINPARQNINICSVTTCDTDGPATARDVQISRSLGRENRIATGNEEGSHEA